MLQKAKIPVLEGKIMRFVEGTLATKDNLSNVLAENKALKSELELVKNATDSRKKSDATTRAESKKRKELSSLMSDLREERKTIEELQDQLDQEIRYVEIVKEAFYTVRLEFEERLGEPAHTLMPKKGGGFETPRVNDLWG